MSVVRREIKLSDLGITEMRSRRAVRVLSYSRSWARTLAAKHFDWPKRWRVLFETSPPRLPYRGRWRS
jgi:hypothetical protein